MAVCGVFERAMITMVCVRSGEGVNEGGRKFAC
jgi:hypothetical protein